MADARQSCVQRVMATCFTSHVREPYKFISSRVMVPIASGSNHSVAPNMAPMSRWIEIGMEVVSGRLGGEKMNPSWCTDRVSLPFSRTTQSGSDKQTNQASSVTTGIDSWPFEYSDTNEVISYTICAPAARSIR